MESFQLPPTLLGLCYLLPVHLESYSGSSVTTRKPIWACFVSGLLHGCQDLSSGPYNCTVSTLKQWAFSPTLPISFKISPWSSILSGCFLLPPPFIINETWALHTSYPHSSFTSHSSAHCRLSSPYPIPHLLHQRPLRIKSPNPVDVYHLVLLSVQSFTSGTSLSLCLWWHQKVVFHFPTISLLASTLPHLPTLAL